MLHDFLLMDEQVLFTIFCPNSSSAHFHHWPSTSPYHSSQLLLVGFFLFPKHSWKIAKLPCSLPYLSVTMLSVNRPLHKTTWTLDTFANSTYWCQTIVASLLFEGIHGGARSSSISTSSSAPWLHAKAAECCASAIHTQVWKMYHREYFMAARVFKTKGRRGWATVGCQGRMNKSCFLFLPATSWSASGRFERYPLALFFPPPSPPFFNLLIHSYTLFIFTIFSVQLNSGYYIFLQTFFNCYTYN